MRRHMGGRGAARPRHPARWYASPGSYNVDKTPPVAGATLSVPICETNSAVAGAVLAPIVSDYTVLTIRGHLMLTMSAITPVAGNIIYGSYGIFKGFETLALLTSIPNPQNANDANVDWLWRHDEVWNIGGSASLFAQSAIAVPVHVKTKRRIHANECLYLVGMFTVRTGIATSYSMTYTSYLRLLIQQIA